MKLLRGLPVGCNVTDADVEVTPDGPIALSSLRMSSRVVRLGVFIADAPTAFPAPSRFGTRWTSGSVAVADWRFSSMLGSFIMRCVVVT